MDIILCYLCQLQVKSNCRLFGNGKFGAQIEYIHEKIKMEQLAPSLIRKNKRAFFVINGDILIDLKKMMQFVKKIILKQLEHRSTI